MSRQAFSSIAVPKLFSDPETRLRVSAKEIEAAFLALNPEIPEEGLSLVCTNKGLGEVRLCLEHRARRWNREGFPKRGEA